MDLQIWKQEQQKKAVLRSSLILLGIALFDALVCSPVSLWSSYDALISESILPPLWDLVMALVRNVFLWGAFASLLYLGVTYGTHACYPFMLGYAGITVLRYLLKQIVGSFVMSEWSDFGQALLSNVLLDVVLDCMLMALAILFLYCFIWRNAELCKQGERKLVFSKLFTWKEPILRCMWLMALLPAVIQLLARLIFDFSELGGPPQNILDLLVMILSYASDILSLFIGYLVIFWWVNQLHLRHQEAKLRANEILQSGDI